MDYITPAMEANTVADFTAEFADKAFGRAEVAPLNDVDLLQMPTLFVYSKDDPCIEFESIDLLRLIRNDKVAVAVTEQGGHCGFLAGIKSTRWMNGLILEFSTAAIAPVI